MAHRRWLLLGVINPLLFWLTTVVCAALLGDYNHLSNLVSELGALGTPTQHLFTAGLVLCSVLNLVWVWALTRAAGAIGISWWPVAPLLLFSFLAGPAIFPMPLRAHGLSGLPFPFFMVSPLLALVWWRGAEAWPGIRAVAVASLVCFAAAFLVFVPDVLAGYAGLKQRWLYLGWTIWSVGLSLRLIRGAAQRGGLSACMCVAVVG